MQAAFQSQQGGVRGRSGQGLFSAAATAALPAVQGADAASVRATLPPGEGTHAASALGTTYITTAAVTTSLAPFAPSAALAASVAASLANIAATTEPAASVPAARDTAPSTFRPIVSLFTAPAAAAAAFSVAAAAALASAAVRSAGAALAALVATIPAVTAATVAPPPGGGCQDGRAKQRRAEALLGARCAPCAARRDAAGRPAGGKGVRHFQADLARAKHDGALRDVLRRQHQRDRPQRVRYRGPLRRRAARDDL